MVNVLELLEQMKVVKKRGNFFRKVCTISLKTVYGFSRGFQMMYSQNTLFVWYANESLQKLQKAQA